MLCEETSDKPAGSMSSEGGDATAESVRINHIVALAWTASGLKRVCSTGCYPLCFSHGPDSWWGVLVYRVPSFPPRITLCSSFALGLLWSLSWSDAFKGRVWL